MIYSGTRSPYSVREMMELFAAKVYRGSIFIEVLGSGVGHVPPREIYDP
jgi:hypothetical protein